jgi:hypothetical protein
MPPGRGEKVPRLSGIPWGQVQKRSRSESMSRLLISGSLFKIWQSNFTSKFDKYGDKYGSRPRTFFAGEIRSEKSPQEYYTIGSNLTRV